MSADLFTELSPLFREKLNSCFRSTASKSNVNDILTEYNLLLKSLDEFHKFTVTLTQEETETPDIKAPLAQQTPAWETLLCDMLANRDKKVVTPFEYYGYYCDLCNYATLNLVEWSSHLYKSFNHFEKYADVKQVICDCCDLILVIRYKQIPLIINSELHVALDSKIYPIYLKPNHKIRILSPSIYKGRKNLNRIFPKKNFKPMTSPGVNYFCTICGFFALGDSTRKWIIHVLNHNVFEGGFCLECPDCYSQIYSNDTNLAQQHLTEHSKVHKSDKKESFTPLTKSEKRQFFCTICCMLIPENLNLWEDHVKNHNFTENEVCLKCSDCGSQIYSNNNEIANNYLELHKKVHINQTRKILPKEKLEEKVKKGQIEKKPAINSSNSKNLSSFSDNFVNYMTKTQNVYYYCTICCSLFNACALPLWTKHIAIHSGSLPKICLKCHHCDSEIYSNDSKVAELHMEAHEKVHKHAQTPQNFKVNDARKNVEANTDIQRPVTHDSNAQLHMDSHEELPKQATQNITEKPMEKTLTVLPEKIQDSSVNKNKHKQFSRVFYNKMTKTQNVYFYCTICNYIFNLNKVSLWTEHIAQHGGSESEICLQCLHCDSEIYSNSSEVAKIHMEAHEKVHKLPQYAQKLRVNTQKIVKDEDQNFDLNQECFGKMAIDNGDKIYSSYPDVGQFHEVRKQAMATQANVTDPKLGQITPAKKKEFSQVFIDKMTKTQNSFFYCTIDSYIFAENKPNLWIKHISKHTGLQSETSLKCQHCESEIYSDDPYTAQFHMDAHEVVHKQAKPAQKPNITTHKIVKDEPQKIDLNQECFRNMTFDNGVKIYSKDPNAAQFHMNSREVLKQVMVTQAKETDPKQICQSNLSQKNEFNYVFINNMTKTQTAFFYCTICSFIFKINKKHLWVKHISKHSRLRSEICLKCHHCESEIFSDDPITAQSHMDAHEVVHKAKPVQNLEVSTHIPVVGKDARKFEFNKVLDKHNVEISSNTAQLHVNTHEKVYKPAKISPKSEINVEKNVGDLELNHEFVSKLTNFKKSFCFCTICDFTVEEYYFKEFLDHMKNCHFNKGAILKCSQCRTQIFSNTLKIAQIYLDVHNKVHEKAKTHEKPKNNVQQVPEPRLIFKDTHIFNGYVTICEQYNNKLISEIYFCRICKTFFISKNNFEKHIAREHQEGDTFKCDYCETEVFPYDKASQNYIKYHEKNCHSEKNVDIPKIFKKICLNLVYDHIHCFCAVCNLTVNDWDNHLTQHKGKFKWAGCPYCEMKIMSVSTPLPYIKYHLEINHKNKDVQLPKINKIYNETVDCNQIFLDIIEKKNKRVQGMNQPSFDAVCLICNMSFIDGFEWIDHLALHCDIEEVKCEKCLLSCCGVKEDVLKCFQHPSHCILDTQI